MADLADLLGFHCVRRFPILSRRRFEILAASSEHNARGLVGRPRLQNLLKQAYGNGEIARAIGGQAGIVQRHPSWRHGSAFGHIKQFVDCNSARPSIDHQPVEFAYLYVIAGKAARFLSDDDYGAIFLICAFKPARDIYGIADHRVIEPEFRSDIADKHVAGIDADAYSERPAAVIGQFRRPKGTLAGERRSAGVDSVIGICRGCAPERHYRIADEFIDSAAETADLARHGIEIAGKERDDLIA